MQRLCVCVCVPSAVGADFGAMLAAIATASGRAATAGLLRAQDEAGVAAAYAFAPADGTGLPHASLALVNYAHCSSPIRRYADLHNQHVLFHSLASPPPSAADPSAVERGGLLMLNQNSKHSKKNKEKI